MDFNMIVSTIAESITSNNMLKHLDLSGNRLTLDHMDSLFKVMRLESAGCDLMCMHLNDNCFTHGEISQKLEEFGIFNPTEYRFRQQRIAHFEFLGIGWDKDIYNKIYKGTVQDTGYDIQF
jgi:hypothetical protein